MCFRNKIYLQTFLNEHGCFHHKQLIQHINIKIHQDRIVKVLFEHLPKADRN